ncbi:hypothetical protein ACFLWF_00810 [Chloroflexota bacterium]
MNSPVNKNEAGFKEDVKPAVKQARIMTLPLPQILEELENHIKRVEQAVEQAKTAALESREAADQAKISGEQAAVAARKAAEAAVIEVRDQANMAIKILGTKVSGLESEIRGLKDKLNKEAMTIDSAFLALEDTYRGKSPFLKS